MPQALEIALESARATGEECELELLPGPGNEPGNQHATRVQRARLDRDPARLDRAPAENSSVFILRDVSAAKQMERDSENLRRQRALVEMSALLAHEIIR